MAECAHRSLHGHAHLQEGWRGHSHPARAHPTRCPSGDADEEKLGCSTATPNGRRVDRRRDRHPGEGRAAVLPFPPPSPAHRHRHLCILVCSLTHTPWTVALPAQRKRSDAIADDEWELMKECVDWFCRVSPTTSDVLKVTPFLKPNDPRIRHAKHHQHMPDDQLAEDCNKMLVLKGHPRTFSLASWRRCKEKMQYVRYGTWRTCLCVICYVFTLMLRAAGEVENKVKIRAFVRCTANHDNCICHGHAADISTETEAELETESGYSARCQKDEAEKLMGTGSNKLKPASGSGCPPSSGTLSAPMVAKQSCIQRVLFACTPSGFAKQWFCQAETNHPLGSKVYRRECTSGECSKCGVSKLHQFEVFSNFPVKFTRLEEVDNTITEGEDPDYGGKPKKKHKVRKERTVKFSHDINQPLIKQPVCFPWCPC